MKERKRPLGCVCVFRLLSSAHYMHFDAEISITHTHTLFFAKNQIRGKREKKKMEY